MKFLDWFRPHEGEFIIHAPLKACIRYVESFPEQESWDAYYKGYTVKDCYQFEANKYGYMLLFGGFRGIRFNTYTAKLNVNLEAIDDFNTQAKCISRISTNFMINSIVGIMVGLIFSFLLIPLIFVFAGVALLYVGYRSSKELIEFHRKQFLAIETRSLP